MRTELAPRVAPRVAPWVAPYVAPWVAPYVALWAVLSVGTSGCAATSFRADLGRLESITGHELRGTVLAEDAPLDEEIEATLARPLDVDAAVRIALARNRELRATLRELGVERGRLLQARLLPNPEIEIDLRQQDDPAQPLQVELFAAFELTEALLTPMRVEVADRDLDAARFRAAARVIETEYEVRAAFYAAQAAEQRLAVGVRSLDALAAARDTAVMLFEAGNVPELDLATQLAAYEEGRATAAELELSRVDARERLSRALGLHASATEWTFAGSLAPAEVGRAVPADLEHAAIESSVELRAARAELEAIGQRIGLSRAEGWIPAVTIDVHGEQDGQTWEMGGGASVSIPIFDRNEGTTAAHEARFDALMERYEGSAIAIRSAARDARNRLASAELRARQYADVIVPARARVFRQTLLQYNAMQVGVFQLIAALRAQRAAELVAIDALRDYWTARAVMDALLRGRRVGGAEAAEPVDTGADESATGGH